jgi:hypothetical protein
MRSGRIYESATAYQCVSRESRLVVLAFAAFCDGFGVGPLPVRCSEEVRTPEHRICRWLERERKQGEMGLHIGLLFPHNALIFDNCPKT